MPSPENPFLKPAENRENHEGLLHLPIDLTDTEIDPETFKRTLITRQTEIIEDINRTYERALENFPGYTDSRLPGKLVAVLAQSAGKKYHRVIEHDAYYANKTGGVFTQMADLKPRFHPYWVAVAEAGFIPEVRVVGNFGLYGTAQLNARITPSIE